MSNEMDKLDEALAEWRKTRVVKDPEAPTRQKSPYGKQIYDLNIAWAEEREAHLKLIEDKRRGYEARMERLTKLHRAWNEEQAGKPKSPQGRPKAGGHPDAVKIAAARAHRAGKSRSAIRIAMGLSDMDKVDEILAEGIALLNAQEQGW